VLLRQVAKSPVPTYAFWALTRLGARMLLYGPMNTIVHPQVVEGWLEELVTFQPGNDSEKNAWAFCLAQLARMSGQRALDIDDSHRDSVLSAMKSVKIPAHWMTLVDEVVELEGAERSQMFGESLPIGLRLSGAG
jgi:DNA-K related protein